jgi:glyoxylase-like metal-dependent hydrolase (beta-lactamase superfamily II)
VEHAICVTCGTQYPPSDTPPAHCPICEDDRQYIGPDGQRWTTLAALRGDHRNAFTEVAQGITAIRTAPEFAIAQHAQLIQTPVGNVLWDCVSLVDDATVTEVLARGGLTAIAISHPHFYSSMVDWSRAFGGVPILLHASNQPWVVRPDSAIQYWEGETHEVMPGVTLVRCGGHFPGSTVLHWAAGAEGQGALFTGDTIMVVPDRRYVSFMYSFPNLIPLDEASVRAIVAAVEPFAFARIYGSWPGRIVQRDGKRAVRTSAERYIAHLRGELSGS